MSFERISAEIQRRTGIELHPSSDNIDATTLTSLNLSVSSTDTRYFLKLTSWPDNNRLECEAQALNELSNAHVNVPSVICSGHTNRLAFLLLEYIELSRVTNRSALAELVARLHSTTKTFYGWEQDNFIGGSRQYNSRSNCWKEFWLQQRLEPQHRWAKSNSVHSDLLKQSTLLQRLSEELLATHHPEPVLLHGDLWHGNFGQTKSGEAIVFDPATYYGDRETDIAMTELFGGTGQDFYSAYWHQLPKQNGYELRKLLYNSYHLLNHYNLFGGHYAHTFMHTVDQLARAMR